MFSGFSLKKRLAALFAQKPLAEISPKLRAALSERIKDEKIFHSLRVEKIFYKKSSAFAGETFFRNVAVLTQTRLILLKDSSKYQEMKNFPLNTVSNCGAQSDGGKPALSAVLSDGSEIRLVFSSDDPEIRVFDDAFRRAIMDAGQNRAAGNAFCSGCGKRVRSDDRFCGACGARLDFIASENRMID